MDPLSIEGAFLFTPRVHSDHRGSFHEVFRAGEFSEATGHSLTTAQTNFSVSARGVLRGVHVAEVPPGQAKYITCVHGAILEVVVDLRTGSPGFGRWEAVRLDDENRRCLYLAEGLGRAFMALTDDAKMLYMCSEPYAPGREHAVDPLDPELGIRWPEDIEPILSAKDAAAPSLAAVQESGVLPGYKDCLEYYARTGSPA
ncbi:dTDP-4-dehydrorhamnose 3,5-epimerase family protein [Actinomadura rugatobispora]|uniref:dTDP-4-dehydrorhamnose 3,5-epimerase family protein n=1 Tax=Actinomadura rugatobispora TaxID=1994 RepID=A0ABW0ZYM6_9ACTN|nr:dTDP-4-dehydrorhamnose 3,5-epimerase [Actinomadura rugatobispora]